MGKFDRKLKNEPDAPGSQTIKKKKSNADLAKLSNDTKLERERNLKLLNWMQRAEESKASSNKQSKADAHIDADKMVKKQIRKEEKKRRKTMAH